MKVIIDKISDGKITVELENKTLAVMDLSIIPDAKEGDVLLITADKTETEERNKKVEKLINKLFEE